MIVKVVAAVCHGPCGLVNVKDDKGEYIVKGKKVTGFTNKEEIAVVKEVSEAGSLKCG